MRAFLAGSGACLVLASTAFAADFAPSYDVEGSDPGGGGGKYTGTVSVKRTGPAVYEVVWSIAGEKFTGTGIGGPDGLAVAYKSGTKTGIAIYRQGGSGAVEGVWTYAGGKQVGEENWTPR